MKSLWTNNIINFIIVMSFLVTSIFAGWLEDLQSGRTLPIADGLKVRVDNISDGVNVNKTHSYFGSHVLKVFVDDAGLSIRKAKGNDGIQFAVFTTGANGTTQARGKDANVFGVLLPLLIGGKIAGSIVTTLIAVLVVSIKALLASLIALVLTGSLALKKFLMGHAPEIHYPVEFMPHHPHPPHHGGYDFLSASGYNAVGPSAHSVLPQASHPTGGGVFSSPYGASGHDIVGADSNISPQYTSATAATSAVNTTPTSVHTSGGKRRIFRRKYPIDPILTVHKITRQTNQ